MNGVEDSAVGSAVFAPCVADKEFEDKLDAMVSKLTSEEIEGAALTSYVYWQEKEKKESDQQVLDDLRRTKSRAMARRCLVGDKGYVEVALKRLRSTLQFRKEMDIDGFYRCFSTDDDKYQDLQKGLEFSMSTGMQVVRGHDKEGRYVQLITAKLLIKSDSDHGFLAQTLYNAERAIAATERATGGKYEKMYPVFDYKSFTHENNLTLSAAKGVVFALRDHYPERVQRIYLLDAPFIFKFFYNLLWPFIDPDTRKKIKFVSGEEKEKEFKDIFDEEHAVPCMLSGGKLTGPHDLKKYLAEVPFDYAYDEVVKS
mmetsp:Transcript_22628/g.51859  ORF Transcript_22628/g.51859 Transcript_22628/m.51859 type:complete len:313 (-) Transcript_22628:300-1238(-)